MFINIYDVTNSQSENTNLAIVRLNNITRSLGAGGVFHGAIEFSAIEGKVGSATGRALN